MSSLLSTKFLLLMGLVTVFFLLFLNKKQPETKKPSSSGMPILLLVLLFGLIAFLAIIRSSSFRSRFSDFYPSSSSSSRAYFYDTDPRNDEYIKGDLSQYQLRRLDRILMDEKRNGGLRLSNVRLQQLARNRPELIDAYERWRKCKDMYRSYHHCVYPDERSLYYYNYRY